MEFVCQACHRILEVRYALPPRCPSCDVAGHWRAIPSLDTPTRDYVLTEKDKKLLRVLRIDPEN